MPGFVPLRSPAGEGSGQPHAVDSDAALTVGSLRAGVLACVVR